MRRQSSLKVAGGAYPLYLARKIAMTLYTSAEQPFLSAILVTVAVALVTLPSV